MVVVAMERNGLDWFPRMVSG